MTESRTHHHRPGRRRLSFLAGALMVVAAPGAMAQGFYVGGGFYDHGPLPPVSPRSVAYRLQDRGFTEITRPRFDGETYVVDATNPAGARVRLFVDARDGAVVGRQRLDAPYYPSARPARPGYGWTEDDLQPRRMARAGEAPIPPANIPDVVPAPRPPAGLAPNAPAELPARAGSAEPNPLGVNPDARTKPAPAPRKTARLSDPQKPPAPRVSPAAPKPDSAEKAKPAAAADTKSAAMNAAEPQKVESPAPAAAPAPAATEGPAPDKAASEKPAAEDPKVAEAPKKEPAWQDPPAGERKVRVIDGATVVPGGSEPPQPSTD